MITFTILNNNNNNLNNNSNNKNSQNNSNKTKNKDKKIKIKINLLKNLLFMNKEVKLLMKSKNYKQKKLSLLIFMELIMMPISNKSNKLLKMLISVESTKKKDQDNSL